MFKFSLSPYARHGVRGFTCHTPAATGMLLKICIPVLMLGCALLASLPAMAQSNTETRHTFLAHQQQIIQQELAGHQRAAQQAQQALQAGQQALTDANAQGNTQAASISQQAIDIAQRTLNNAQHLIGIDQSRLDAIQRAMRWTHTEEAYGIPALLHGNVMVRSHGQLQPLDPDIPIRPGQELVTGANASFEVITDTGARVDVGPNSRFVYLTNKNSESELLTGLLHITESALKGSAEMNVFTPNSVIGVRGTEFVVDVSNDVERIYLLKGSIDVQLRASHQRIGLQAGQMVVVNNQGFAGSPQFFDAASVPTWSNSE